MPPDPARSPAVKGVFRHDHQPEPGRPRPRARRAGHRRCSRTAAPRAAPPARAARATSETSAAAESPPCSDSVRLAVLAALNIADELFRCRDATDQRNGQLAERTEELERLLDRVLTL